MTRSTVYLVDDELELLELLSEAVRLAGLNAQAYSRADRLFAEVEEFEAGSIVVLDLHMPEMDGIEVMRRLAHLPRRPAVILLSGQGPGVLHAAEMLGRARDLEILASLSKPVSTDDFQQLLRRHATFDRGHRAIRSPAATPDISPDDLHHAILNDALTLHYQPQVAFATSKLIGVEALVRWQHPKHGLIPPGRFLPIVERCGWMGELTAWVMDTAVKQDQAWQGMGLPVAVSVNISADSITSLTLPEQLAKLLADNQLEPTRFTLEVTESELMTELIASLDILTRLRLKGIGLSLDDFGTGYSSLSQLHRVPFTELKVDQSSS